MADAHDPTIAAALLAVALGLIKVLERVITWAFKKLGPEKDHGKTMVVHLAPEVSEILREVHKFTTRTSEEGVPLLYGPRAEIKILAAALDSTNEKIDEVDAKADALLGIISKKQQ